MGGTSFYLFSKTPLSLGDGFLGVRHHEGCHRLPNDVVDLIVKATALWIKSLR
jgi:hypothetical protein